VTDRYVASADRLGRLGRLARFGTVGALNTTVDVLVFSALVFGIGVWPSLANLAAFSVAVCCSYVLNRHWVFAGRPPRGPQGTAFSLFVVLNAMTALVSTAVLTGLIALDLRILWAKAVATLASMVLNYLCFSSIVFTAPGRRAGRGATARPGGPGRQPATETATFDELGRGMRQATR
jgi:putative flippase GtrA